MLRAFPQQQKGDVVNAKFSLGETVITPAALDTLHPEDVQIAITRHASGDWGDVCDEGRTLNDESLKEGTRVLSAYTDRNGTKFWIITEADRSVTTVLLPDDY